MTDATIPRESHPQEAVGSGTDGRILSSSSWLYPPPDPPTGQSTAGNSLNFAHGTSSVDEVTTPVDDTYEGGNSIVAMLRQHADDRPSSSRIRDARVFFGLQNSFSSDPLFTVPTPQQKWVALLRLSPQNQEIHR